MNDILQLVFAPDGLLAKRFQQHEQRDGQREMAEQVLAAFEDNRHTAIQAGTGLGKTFAYLIPAAIYAATHKKRVVISTGTLNLQSQIIKKDIPALQRILGDHLVFNAALVKGRNNYICTRKLTAFSQATMQQELYREPGDAEQWPQIADLFYEHKFINGDRDEIPFRVSDSLWADIGAEADLCMKSKCPFYGDCFFYQARQQQRSAQLLITNHALFFADLTIRRENQMSEEYSEATEAVDAVLVNYDGVVFDEAQSVEDFATECFTARFSWDRLFYMARTAASVLKPGGLLQWPDEMDFMRVDSMFNVLLQKAEAFFYALGQQWNGERTTRFREPQLFEEDLSDRLKEIGAEFQHLQSIAQNEEQKQVLGGLSLRANQAAQDLLTVRDMPEGESFAYWLETGERQLRQIKLAASPVSIAEMMREGLFERVPVVLTSATLASELVQRLGLSKPRWLRLDSPFDYQSHARLYLPQDAPEASPQNEQIFSEFVARRVPELTAISKGRAFILFTSYRAMQACYYQCADVLREQGWLVLMQGEKRRDQLLAEFIEHGHAVLFAVNSFWEGVDVQGDSLSLVVLVKLPFAVPSEPIQQARMEALQREGKDPFRTFTLPQAILRLKQGFGRLIRSKQDSGVIAVLDKRILTKYYGSRFLRDLPPAPQIRQLDEVAQFFTLLEEARDAQHKGLPFTWPATRPAPAPRSASASGSSAQSKITEDGWWLPEEETHTAAAPRRSPPRPRDSNDIVFDDLAGEEAESRTSASQKSRYADEPQQRPTKEKAPRRTVQAMAAEDIVFDDLAGWEEPEANHKLQSTKHK